MKIKYIKPEEIKQDCKSASMDENGWFCYRRIYSIELVQNSPCSECGKFQKNKGE